MFSFFKSAEKPAEPAKAEVKKEGWLQRLKTGLTKSREKISGRLTALFSRGKIDEALYEELEEILLGADVGVTATKKLIDDVRARVRKEKLSDASELKGALKGALSDLLSPLERRMALGHPVALALGHPVGHPVDVGLQAIPRYDASGRLKEKWLPNQVKTRYNYKSDNTLTQVVNRSLTATIISQLYGFPPSRERQVGHLISL